MNEVSDIDGLLNDFNRDLSQYLSAMENPEEELHEVTKRLDQINHLKAKYGNSIDQIIAYGKECETKLVQYRDYDEYRSKLNKILIQEEESLNRLCETFQRYEKKGKEFTLKIKKHWLH